MISKIIIIFTIILWTAQDRMLKSCAEVKTIMDGYDDANEQFDPHFAWRVKSYGYTDESLQ